MDAKLQELISQLPVIQKAHIYLHNFSEPEIEEVARISFKAGVEQGRREVIEWIQPYIDILPLVSVKRWQAQLKEWGE